MHNFVKLHKHRFVFHSAFLEQPIACILPIIPTLFIFIYEIMQATLHAIHLAAHLAVEIDTA